MTTRGRYVAAVVTAAVLLAVWPSLSDWYVDAVRALSLLAASALGSPSPAAGPSVMSPVLVPFIVLVLVSRRGTMLERACWLGGLLGGLFVIETSIVVATAGFPEAIGARVAQSSAPFVVTTLALGWYFRRLADGDGGAVRASDRGGPLVPRG